MSEEEEEESPLRRSKRDRHTIRIRPEAFRKRVHQLFFEPLTWTDPSDLRDLFGGCQLDVRVEKSRFARIYVLEDFLSKSDVDFFLDFASTCTFERSFVDNMDHARGGKRTLLDAQHRTSTFFAFKKFHNARIRALEQRVADLFGCFVDQIEALQLVRYLPHQFFGLHHDLGNLLDDGSVELPPRSAFVKRRLVTMFVYINDIDEKDGGATHFPEFGRRGGLKVQPKQGRAVLWTNIDREGNPEPRTVHEGMPVGMSRKGRGRHRNDDNTVKFGLNIWICER